MSDRRGTKNIDKVNLRKITNYKSYNMETGNYEKSDICVLDTIGSNLSSVLALDYIDSANTFTNDIMEMYSVLGIEAARKCLFNEILDVMEFDSTYINHHHLHLLCFDRMTCNEKLVRVYSDMESIKIILVLLPRHLLKKQPKCSCMFDRTWGIG